MGEFIARIADAFGLDNPHVVGPDIGTSAGLFAAAAYPGRLRSLVVGSGGAAVPLQLGGILMDWVVEPDLEKFRSLDPREIVAGALSGLERYTLPDATREDYLSAYESDRFVESMRFVRTYPTELPALRDLLQDIKTPVQIIAGGLDWAVPPANAEFLHERLPHSKLDIIDAGHFTWEDAADEYATLVTSWWHGGYSRLSLFLNLFGVFRTGCLVEVLGFADRWAGGDVLVAGAGRAAWAWSGGFRRTGGNRQFRA